MKNKGEIPIKTDLYGCDIIDLVEVINNYMQLRYFTDADLDDLEQNYDQICHYQDLIARLIGMTFLEKKK
jgi:hypothetical protein